MRYGLLSLLTACSTRRPSPRRLGVDAWDAGTSPLLLSLPIFLLPNSHLSIAVSSHCVSFTARKIDTYHMPASIGISHLNSGSVPDVMTLNIVNNDDEENAGLCEILMGIGGAIAGSVNSVAGGAFSVGSVACKAI
jgi:hypothetical protein